MAITVGTNSYITVNEANAYFAERLYATTWTGSPNDWEKALLMARRVIDQQQYVGAITDEDQLLAWPRTGVYDQDGRAIGDTTVPQAIKDAQAELAMALLASDLTANDSLRGVRRKLEKVGPLESLVEYDGRAPSRPLPDHVAAILRPFLASAAPGTSVRIVL